MNKPKMPDALLLDADAVAALLGLSRRTIFRMAAAGLLPEPVRINRKLVRFPALAIHNWLAQRGAIDPPSESDQTWERALNAKAAARLLGVEASTVNRLAREGKLPRRRTGGVSGKLYAEYTVPDLEALAGRQLVASGGAG